MKALTTAAALLVASISHAQLATQVDDFSDGSFGWGAPSQAISIEADGGPAGTGDAYFAYTSTGVGMSNSRMVIPNEILGNQWTGDYAAAGVTGFAFDVINDGPNPLDVRISIADTETWYTSTEAITISPGSTWTPVEFSLDAASMTRQGLLGMDSFEAVFANVSRVRIVSSQDLPPISFGGTGAPQGDRIEASIGFDNFRAIAIPEPSCLVLSALAMAACAARRRA